MKKTQTKTNASLFRPQADTLVSTPLKVLLSLLVGAAFSLISVVIVRSQYISSLEQRVSTVAVILNPDKINDLKNNKNVAPNEATLKRQLLQARNVNNDTRFLYLMAINSHKQVYFLVDSEQPNSRDFSPRGQIYTEASPALVNSFTARTMFVEGPFSDRWGNWLSVFAPVYSDKGEFVAMLGMDIPSSTYITIIGLAAVAPFVASCLVAGLFILTDSYRRRRQESVRMRSELVSIASHELRTPLTGIRWGEETLLNTKNLKNDKETLRTMYESTLRLQESIEDILQLANWQAGRSDKLLKTPTNISSIISSIFATQKLPAAQRDVTLEFSKDWPKDLIIKCDQQRMKRVFNNLISNAIKYSRAHTTITVGYDHIDHKHLISIIDRGIGIPAKEQSKVFKGFYRASNAVTHETSGTGMGLYMSRAAIEQHGGKLWLKSEENVGTTVYIQLP
jgi:signal transduction histidine kinase